MRDHPAASPDSTFTWTDLTDLVFFSRLGRVLQALLLPPAWVCLWVLAGRMLFGLLGLGGGMLLFLSGCVAATGIGATLVTREFRELCVSLMVLGAMLLFMCLLYYSVQEARPVALVKRRCNHYGNASVAPGPDDQCCLRAPGGLVPLVISALANAHLRSAPPGGIDGV